jgi:dipeptidyl aminopeptidase/acylaminoacyl peptidase
VLITDRDRVAPAVSANGQVAVAVRTDRNGALGSALGKGGADKWSDIAIYDFGQRRETQVDVSSNGTPADADSFNPSISPDGNQVAFASDASNLGAAPDVDPHTDIFLRDMATNTTVSITPAADGDSGKTATTQVGDKFSIAFESTATNLPGAASGNGMQDIFVAQEGAAPNSFTLEPISVGMGGVPANGPSSDPAIVPSGAMVAFASLASNLVVGDGNGVSDVFLRDRITGTNTKLSDGVGGAPADGASGAPAVAELGGGLWVAAFDSEASNLVALDLNNDTDVFVRSSTGPIELASRGMGGVPANGKSLNPALSPDGRYVTFTSTASNLVPNDTNNAPDVFVYDRNTGTTTRVSVSNSSQQADDFSLQPAIGLGAGGAPLVVFDSLAGNLAANDNDEAYDLFRASLAGGIESTDEVIFRSGFE